MRQAQYGTLVPTKLDKIKNLHSTDTIDTENSGTRGRPIWVHSSQVGKADSKWVCHVVPAYPNVSPGPMNGSILLTWAVSSAGRAGIVTSSLPLTGVLLHLRFYASRRFRTTKKPAYTRACGRVEAITDMAMASTLFLRSGQRPTQPARPPFPAPC